MYQFRYHDDILYMTHSEYLNIRLTELYKNIIRKYDKVKVIQDYEIDDYNRLTPLDEHHTFLYGLYEEYSSPKYWSDLVDKCEYVPLTDSQIENVLSGDHSEVAELIDYSMTRLPGVLFIVKADQCDINIPLVSSGRDTIHRMMLKDDIVDSFKNNKSKGILVRWWNDAVDSSTIITVFVKHRKVVSVKEKRRGRYINYTGLIDKFQKLYDTFNLKFTNMVFDGYMDHHGLVHLLKIESFIHDIR